MEEKKETKKEKIVTIEIDGEIYEMHLSFRDYIVLEQALDIGLTALIELSAGRKLKITQIATILHLGLNKKFTKNEILEMMDPVDGKLNPFYANARATALLLKIMMDQMESMPDEFKKKSPTLKIPKNK